MARVNDIRFVGYGVPNIEEEARFYIDAWKLRSQKRRQFSLLDGARKSPRIFIAAA